MKRLFVRASMCTAIVTSLVCFSWTSPLLSGQMAATTVEAAAIKVQNQGIEVHPAVTHPGDVILVRSKTVSSITLFQKNYRLARYNGEYIAFVPIPMGQKPATYTIRSTGHSVQTTLTVQKKQFQTDAITVSKQMESMRQNTKRIEADQVKINKARSVSSPAPLFDGKFQLPIKGKRTTPYGYQRIVNGKPSSPHLAVDLANSEGTPIVAPQNGKVTLAEPMYLNGNMIIIDHGLRLFSTYSHLSKLLVKPGDYVKKGQVIGKVGTTGFSTGAHLHYAMLIGNTFVNPQPFFDRSPFEWK